MLATLTLALGAFLFAPQVFSQQNNTNDRRYTVWSSVIFTRTGERTPEVLGYIPTTLTAEGANQAFNAGNWFRHRYILSQQSDGDNSSTLGADVAGRKGPIYGLSENIYDPMQIFAASLEQQYNLATAQAFLQGLYPPWTPGPGNNESADSVVKRDPNVRNGQYITAPLDGYQYPQVHSSGPNDYNYIYLSGNLNCPSFDSAAREYTRTERFAETQEEWDRIYNAIGPAVFGGVLDSEYWDYTNAYAIYDYLRYQNDYNETIAADLARYEEVNTGTPYLDILRWLADEQQYAQLGNVSAYNVVNKAKTLPGVQTGSISTIGGNMLVARVMDGLTDAIVHSGSGQYKLNLLFADYHPLMSFFSIVGLPSKDANFYGTPNFGASAVFELFSYTNASDTNPEFPSPDELMVRFYFRNGTNSTEEDFQAYPLFDNGPNDFDMSWSAFQYAMYNILMVNVGDWCTLCNSTNIFCEAYSQEQASDAVRNWLEGNGVSSGGNGNKVSPAVAGVIGAIVTLVVAGIIFGLAMLIGGIRFHRNATSRKSDLGGFKGGQKMRSDEDLTIPKGGAIVGASVVNSPTSPQGGHERVGSWELKSAEAGRHLDVGHPEMRQSEEIRRPSPDPFADPHNIRPTLPNERV